ncbi:hypothetical protein F4559_002736 [Saccharothrix violaceirubra]|uniref:Uncharacterized protein n=1 Tax=Saccharothrix violaceirubra TaxID=413306 RepID=A0A7W7T2G3_9PSEU|nr:hypothetical protein [Saccharothrix violaceirubra]
MSTLNPALRRDGHPTNRPGPTGLPVGVPSTSGTRSSDWSAHRPDTPRPPAGGGSDSAGTVAGRPRPRQV